MGLIFSLSSQPVPEGRFWALPDYLLHAIEYCGLFTLWYWAVHEGIFPLMGRGGNWVPLVGTVLFAFSDEWHQSFVATRDSSMRDIAADTAGALLGIGFILVLRSISRRYEV